MMTLDEAIKHCYEVADGALCDGTVNHKACGEEHRQLARWLEELKTLREQLSQVAVKESNLKHGKWKSWEEQFPDKKIPRKNNLGVFCSTCKSHADNRTDYCPHCGGRMDGDSK